MGSAPVAPALASDKKKKKIKKTICSALPSLTFTLLPPSKERSLRRDLI